MLKLTRERGNEPGPLVASCSLSSPRLSVQNLYLEKRKSGPLGLDPLSFPCHHPVVNYLWMLLNMVQTVAMINAARQWQKEDVGCKKGNIPAGEMAQSGKSACHQAWQLRSIPRIHMVKKEKITTTWPPHMCHGMYPYINTLIDTKRGYSFCSSSPIWLSTFSRSPRLGIQPNRNPG